ncbi:olfactory receptor 5AR1-like [Gastrophryne carolinensis]
MQKIQSANGSQLVEFTIQCFSDLPELQLPLFVLFFIIYIDIIFGNIVVFTSILFDSHLHTPMYFFLCNLSVLDISYSTTILPNLLAMLYTQDKIVSLARCIAQMYFFLTFACCEMILLAVMAYDRYAAICCPLQYSILMNPKHCLHMVSSVWVTSLMEPVVFTMFVANLSFCSSNVIDHFYCDASPLLKLSCSDTAHVNLTTYVFGAVVGCGTFVLTLVSYVFIISNIMKIQSLDGRQKTFSTCASHLTCVIVFYGTTLCLYMRPTSMYSPMYDKFFSLLYIILIPILNPIIYTLKNEQFKEAFKKIIRGLYLC